MLQYVNYVVNIHAKDMMFRDWPPIILTYSDIILRLYYIVCI